jgi:predicted TIM-barrel fold metal-dependent hydrolase
VSSDGFRVFDSDLHVLEPPDLWTRYVDARFRDRVPVGLARHPGDLLLQHGGAPWGRAEHAAAAAKPRVGHNFAENRRRFQPFDDAGWDGKSQLEAMDAEGVDLAVLFPSRGLFALSIPDLDPPLAAAMARAYNDWLAELIEADPTRMVGAAMISPFDVDDAVAETRRAVRELGFCSVFLRANLVAAHNWHDPYYDPLWAEIADLGVALGFHEATGSAGGQVGDRFADNPLMWHVVSHPLDQMLAVVSFCCGGILERHPDLRVAFLEGNCSWLPFLLWRMDEHQEWIGDEWAGELTMAPSEYFRRQCFVSVECDEEPASHPIADGLLDRIVFSTDFPHPDSKYPRAVQSFLELDLADDAKRAILWDNCRALYGLD